MTLNRPCLSRVRAGAGQPDRTLTGACRTHLCNFIHLTPSRSLLDASGYFWLGHAHRRDALEGEGCRRIETMPMPRDLAVLLMASLLLAGIGLCSRQG
jgi:hypothetical protein